MPGVSMQQPAAIATDGTDPGFIAADAGAAGGPCDDVLPDLRADPVHRGDLGEIVARMAEEGAAARPVPDPVHRDVGGPSVLITTAPGGGGLQPRP